MKDSMSFFQKVYRSITKPSTYIYFGNLKLKSCILYLALISICFGTLASLNYVYHYNKFISAIDKEVNNGFPDFQFKDGILEVNQDTPIVLTEKSKYVIIVDTIGISSKDTLDSYDKVILILKDKAYIKNAKFQIDEVYFDIMRKTNFDKQGLKESIGNFRIYTILIILLFIFGIFIINIFQTFMISLIGTVINGVLRGDIKYSKLFKLSIFTITPTLIFNSLIRLIGIKYINLYYLYLVVNGVYLFLAIRQIIIEDLKNKEAY